MEKYLSSNYQRVQDNGACRSRPKKVLKININRALPPPIKKIFNTSIHKNYEIIRYMWEHVDGQKLKIYYLYGRERIIKWNVLCLYISISIYIHTMRL